MSLALSYARRGVGRTAPNPSVGCVIVRNDEILAAARTADGGRPHAETLALAQAGKRAKGATAYVTLEPCCHQGKTGPCTEALINAGIKTVVIALQDPFPAMQGKGLARLREAGLEVITGQYEEQAHAINEGFFSVQARHRPFVTLKLATSQDGMIAASPGLRTKISGDIAHAYAHLLRSRSDAIMVGIGTVLSDDPLLTCRLPGLEHTCPIRIVMDNHLRLPAESALVRTAGDVPLWVITTCDKTPPPLAKKKVRTFYCPENNLQDALKIISDQGITRLLIEGGRTLATAAIEQKLVDELIWIRSPHIIGEGGLPALAGYTLPEVLKEISFSLRDSRMLGEDRLKVFLTKY